MRLNPIFVLSFMRRTCFAYAALLGAQALSGQSLAQRVSSAHGSVAFEYDTKPNVCGNGSSIDIRDDRSSYSNSRSGIHIGRSSSDDRYRCEQGPARVVLTRSGSDITDVTVTVGSRDPNANTDLGTVASAEAAQYLLDVAPRLSSHGADHAVLGAAIADGPSQWRHMLAIARDNSASEQARKATLFWVSQEATDVATAGISDVANDDSANISVRKDALFFLAQRKGGEGVPALVRVVEQSKSGSLRKEAIFYLSQSRDPRALDLFERLLAGR